MHDNAPVDLEELAMKAHTPTRYGPAPYGPPPYGARRCAGGKYGERPGATRY